MKLLGYKEIKGEKNGKSWDFVQLVIDKEETNTDYSGGVQLCLRRGTNGYSLPSVSIDVWNAAVKNGVRIGSSVKLFMDMSGQIIFDIADSPFQNVV